MVNNDPTEPNQQNEQTEDNNVSLEFHITLDNNIEIVLLEEDDLYETEPFPEENNNLQIVDNNILENYPTNEYNNFMDLVNRLSDVLNNIITDTDSDMELEDVKLILPLEEVNNLNHIKYSIYIKNNSINKNDNCSICLNEYKNENEIIICPCSHIYHSNCIGNWLLNYSNLCPLCKKPVSENTIIK